MVMNKAALNLPLKVCMWIFFSLLLCEFLLSRSSHVQHFVTPGTVARQASPSWGFSRLEHWSGLPCPPLEDLPNPGIEAVFHYVSFIGRQVLCY